MTDKELAEEYEEKAEYIKVNDDGKKYIIQQIFKKHFLRDLKQQDKKCGMI